jgi:hypothetical protein
MCNCTTNRVLCSGRIGAVYEIFYDVNNHPVLCSIEYHVPDAFVFVVERAGPYV